MNSVFKKMMADKNPIAILKAEGQVAWPWPFRRRKCKGGSCPTWGRKKKDKGGRY